MNMDSSLKRKLKSAYRSAGLPLKNLTDEFIKISYESFDSSRAVEMFFHTCRAVHRHHRAEVLSKNRRQYHAKRYYENLRRQWKEEDRPHFSVIFH